jgi:hypothetical protein
LAYVRQLREYVLLVVDILVDGTGNFIDGINDGISSHESHSSSLAGWKAATS